MGYRFAFSEITKYIPLLLKGLQLSVIISVLGMVLGCILGIVIATGSSSKNKVVRGIIRGYIEIFRNTPLLIQMYIFYFGLGQFNIQVPPFYSALLAITLNNGAYTGVIFKTGINAVDNGQIEASQALGMNAYQSFIHIILPQAFRIVVPPLTNQFISLFLFSSVAATISLKDLMYQTLYVESITMRTFETFIIASVLYLCVTSIITVFSGIYEKKVFKY